MVWKCVKTSSDWLRMAFQLEHHNYQSRDGPIVCIHIWWVVTSRERFLWEWSDTCYICFWLLGQMQCLTTSYHSLLIQVLEEYTVDHRSAEDCSLSFTKKIGSAEACQASLPINKFKREQFWQMPLPFGVNGCERRRLIDVDECGIELNRTNCKDGHTYSGIRVVKPIDYSRDTKLPPGVRGSMHNPRRWLHILIKDVTNTIDFHDFVESICTELQNNHLPGMVGNQSCFFCGTIFPHIVHLLFIKQWRELTTMS